MARTSRRRRFGQLFILPGYVQERLAWIHTQVVEDEEFDLHRFADGLSHSQEGFTMTQS